MPTRVDYSIPPPTTWESFENLCRDLWAEEWNYTNTQKNGRKGQPQNGVDVYGEPKPNYWVGVQAKVKGQLPAKTLNITELHAEIEKAKNFIPKLKEYIVATTGSKDVNIQEEARKITEKNRKNGLFDVFVYCWEDIEPLLKKHQNVHKLHYPQHFPDLKAIESLSKQVLDEQKDNFEKTSEDINGLRLEIKSGFKQQAEQASIGGDITQEHQAELNYARDLINKHKSVTALDYLKTLKDRIWNQTNQNIRFRLLTNIAASMLQIGDEKKAAELFIEALQYNPDDEKALCNVALAYILLNAYDKSEKYVKKVLSKNPTSGRAYTILIQIRSDTEIPLKNIINEIPQEYHDLPDIAYALGAVCRRRRHYREAQKYFKKLNSTEKTQPEYLVSLGTTLVASISKNMYISFNKNLTKNEIKKIKEATNLFEEAWKKIKSYEDNSLKRECLANMGISNMLLGNLEKAAVNYDDALVIEPDDPTFTFSRAYIDYVSEKKSFALDRLKKIYKTSDIPAAILIGDIYLSTYSKNHELLRNEALPIIEEYIHLNPPIFLKHAAVRLQIQILIVLQELETATEIVDKLVKDNPKDINSLVSKSRIYRLLKKTSIAAASLSEADMLVDKKTTHYDLLALADEHNFTGKYNKAAIYYERIADANVDDDITRGLIDCYLKLGNHQKVLTICQAIRKNQGLVRKIIELEASIYEDIGDLVKAKKLCQDYLIKNPNDEKVGLHLATINYRDQKWKEVDEYLKKSFDYEKLTLKYRIQYAELLSVRGFDKQAINVMYETRRKYFDQSKAHLHYIAILFRDEEKNDELLRPKNVATDTAVLMEVNNQEKTWYLIEDRSDTDSAKNEFTSQHPLIKKLLGNKVGDTIELVSNSPQKKFGKILEIKSKYIYALHNSMSSYQTRFPEAEGLYSIDIKSSQTGNIEEKDLKVFFDQIDKHHEKYEFILNLYKDGKLTIGAMSSILGKNPIEAWGFITSQEVPGMRCSIGDANIRRDIQITLNSKPKLAIDILSLMTIQGLSVADSIVTNFGKLLISQSTIDVLTDLITNRKGLYSKGFFTVGKQGKNYVKEEISAEQLKKNTEYLKGILKWVEKNCLIIPCREALTLDPNYREKLYKLFGHSFIDSILIAKQENALFYSDDERLRSFANGTYNLKGVWTQAVIENLLNQRIIVNNIYQDAVIKLVNSNYIFTSINADTLIEITKKSKWKPDRNFIKVVKLLNGKNCDIIPAVNVVSEYIYKILNQAIYLDDPKNICFVVLDNAIKDRNNKQEFIKRLEFRLKKVFLLSPNRMSEAIQILKSWLRVQIL